MFELGIIIGIYSYSIFLLGLLGLLYAPLIWIVNISFFIVSLFLCSKNTKLKKPFDNIISYFKVDILSFFLFFVLVVQIFINFIGVLGPELGFDALWYHLTLPKIYLLQHTITFIPGGLLYYSAMPKLLELIYTGVLAFGSSTFPKLIHFGFGLLVLVSLYAVSIKFLSKRFSLLVLVIFYANLVVGWESISAYIDLGRTFFELLSFWTFLQWIEKKEKKLFIFSAIFLGLAITTKILALGSLLIMLFLIALISREEKTKIIKPIISYVAISMVIPLPWLIFSFIYTNNPFYPFFTHTYPVFLPFRLINPIYFIESFWNLLLYSQDPLNPFYLITLPLIFLYFKSWSRNLKLVFLYVLGGLFFWYITPHTGGGRFILPYLPMLSLVSVVGMLSVQNKFIKQYLFFVVVIIALISIGYRTFANAKFIPVILGQEPSNVFLKKHLNFSFGDFIDNDNYFKRNIKSTDKVLLYGFHNLYYVDFPFIDSSYVKKGDIFNYIAVQNGALPKRFQTWTLIYINPMTHVSLFSTGGIPWTY